MLEGVGKNVWGRRWGIALLLGSACAFSVPAASEARGSARARASHTISGNDNAKLHYVRTEHGSTLLEEGQAQGALPGRVKAYLRVEATFTGTFTIYARNGSLTGRGTATPHGSGPVESFSGTFKITGGTGRYAHASGHGSLYGTFRRRNYEVFLQPRATIHY